MTKNLTSEEVKVGGGGGGVNPNSAVGETVTLSKDQFDTLNARLSKLEQRGAVQLRPKRVTEHTAKIRVHEGSPVVWMGNVTEKKDNVLGKMVAWMDIKTFDGKKYVVQYLDFLNSPNSVGVSINSQKMEEFETVLGVRNAVNPDEAKIGNKNWKPREVEDRVVSRKYTSKITVQDGELKGQEFTVPNDCLNS